eukprot:COSAG05_NODE_908_length_6643_cov_2.923441_6_plen_94_part_00
MEWWWRGGVASQRSLVALWCIYMHLYVTSDKPGQTGIIEPCLERLTLKTAVMPHTSAATRVGCWGKCRQIATRQSYEAMKLCQHVGTANDLRG